VKATRLRRLDRLERRARAEARVGGVVRVPDTIGYPPPPDWEPPGGWPRGGILLVPEVLSPEAWSERYGRTSGEQDGHEE
jgi:hypothetical protein